MASTTDCTTKHMKIITIIVVLVLAIVGAASSLASSTTDAHDTRLRQVEQDQAAVMARLDGLQRTCDSIARKIDSRQSFNDSK